MTLMNQFKSQKGAMFGLDARIALAIFAGLSVVAGAAIVNAIRDTGPAALATEFDNISKGYVNFQLENSIDTATVTDIFGPYVQATSSHPQYGDYDIKFNLDGALATTAAGELAAADSSCDSTTPCFVWLELTDVPSNVVLELEKKYDDSTATSVSSANSTGVFRYTAAASGLNDVYFQLSRAFTAFE